MRAARFGTGAGKPLAAEGLHPDHGADLVAVHVSVPGAHARKNVVAGLVHAGVNAVSQSIARGIDGLDDRIELI